MIKLNLNILKEVNGGLPNANENAPGGLNTTFISGTDGFGICRSGESLIKVTPTAAPSYGIVNVFADRDPSRTVDQIITNNPGICG